MQSKKKKVKNSKILKAIVSSMLILTLTSSNFFILGKEVVAFSLNNFFVFDKELNKQTEDTINKNIKFDAFFKANEQKDHYLTYNLNGESQELYLNLKVKQGFLKNAEIEFQDKNYVINEIVDENQIVQEVNNDKITLKQVNENEQTYLITAKISASIEDQIDIDNLEKESKIILKAIYINKDGKEILIEKEIKINIGFIQEMKVELARRS